MKTIMITGGAGFIGSNLVRYIYQKTDYNIVVVDKLTYAGHQESIADLLDSRRVIFEQQDIVDGAVMQALFTQHQPDYLINIAAETHVDRSIDDASPFIQTNIVGVHVLLETARQQYEAQPDFRMLHVSTDEVYGSLGSHGFFHETTPYAPSSPYAASKAAADHLAHAWFRTYGVPVMVTHCSNNYGPCQYPEKLIPLMLLNALEAKDLPVYGDGKHIRDWLYVEDHCSGIMCVLEKGRPGERYNIGANNEYTNLDIVHRLCHELEKHHPAVDNKAMQARGLDSYEKLIDFVEDRPGHDRRYAIDAGKIRNDLGWAPAHDVVSGIARTVEWYLHNTDWCYAVTTEQYDRQRLGVLRENT